MQTGFLLGTEEFKWALDVVLSYVEPSLRPYVELLLSGPSWKLFYAMTHSPLVSSDVVRYREMLIGVLTYRKWLKEVEVVIGEQVDPHREDAISAFRDNVTSYAFAHAQKEREEKSA